MNADQTLSETFADHEHLAPDAGSTMDGIRQQLRGRRRTATRSLTIAGAAATVVAVTLGVSTLGADPAQAPPLRSAAPVTAARGPDFVTIAPGWLPAGWRQDGIYNSYGKQTRFYGHTDGLTRLQLGLTPGAALPTKYERGTPRDLQVGGRPAREWRADDSYHLAILEPGRQVATVSLVGLAGSGNAADLAATGRRIGAALLLDRHDPIPVGYTLGTVPRGLEIRGIDWLASIGTGYTLAPPQASAQDGDTHHIHVAESSGPTDDLLKPSGGVKDPSGPAARAKPGRLVQGHRTWLIDNALLIDRLAGGHLTLITSGSGISVETLYAVADGIRSR